jgi:FkbM family methyltransferase
MKLPEDAIVVQIGTNDGKDDFHDLCVEYLPSKIVLVEPNKILLPYILTNYKSIISSVYVEIAAITEVNKGIVELHIPQDLVDKKKEKENPIYATGHYSLFETKEWYGHETKTGRTIQSPSMTFEELCEKYQIKDIDFLQIDAEGYDWKIIESIDFEKHNIKLLQYESTYFDVANFMHHTEADVKIGQEGMLNTFKYLVAKGYKMERIDDMNVLGIKE